MNTNTVRESRVKSAVRKIKHISEKSRESGHGNDTKTAWDKSQMASELSACNKELRIAAESYMKQRREIEAMKSNITRLKRFNMQSSLERSKQAINGAHVLMATSSKRLVTAYNVLQNTVDACNAMAYRKEYRDAKKSLNEFAVLKSSLIRNMRDKQAAAKNESREDGPSEERGDPKMSCGPSEGVGSDQQKFSAISVENLNEDVANYVSTPLDRFEGGRKENEGKG